MQRKGTCLQFLKIKTKSYIIIGKKLELLRQREKNCKEKCTNKRIEEMSISNRLVV